MRNMALSWNTTTTKNKLKDSFQLSTIQLPALHNKKVLSNMKIGCLSCLSCHLCLETRQRSFADYMHCHYIFGKFTLLGIILPVSVKDLAILANIWSKKDNLVN